MRYYGWRIAWALAVTQTVGFGVLFYGFSVFTLPMEQELGWSRAQTSGAYSLALLISGLLALPVGRWVDARGARLPMTAGSVAASLLIFLWSHTHSLLGLYVVQALIGVAMSMVLYDIAFTVLATWFRRDRIRAMLIVTSVAGLASTIFIPLATFLVEAYGWREALRLLALLHAALAVPLHGLVLRDRPERVGQLAHAGGEPERALTVREALRLGAFWRLTTAFSLDRMVAVAIAAHSVPLLLERGHGPGAVAAVTGSIGLLQVAGRFAFAPAAGRFSLATLAAATFATRAAAMLALLLVPGAAGPWSFAVLFGLANGATTLARAGLVGEVFGSRHYGAINGSMSSVIAVAQTVAPMAVGALRVAGGDYRTALWALFLLAAFSLFSLQGMPAAGRLLASGFRRPPPP